LHQVRKADRLHELRTQRAGLYSELLADVPELILPRVMPNRIHSWHLYPVRLRQVAGGMTRGTLIEELKAAGISTSVHWMPLHLHPYYRDYLGCQPADCPCATSLYPELFSLPLYPDLDPEQVGFVCRTLKNIFAANRATVAVTGVADTAGEAAWRKKSCLCD
jgi:perosamine synthetase